MPISLYLNRLDEQEMKFYITTDIFFRIPLLIGPCHCDIRRNPCFY